MVEQQFAPDWFSKPGDTLLSLMQRRKVAASELAEALDGGCDTLHGLLAGATVIDHPVAQALASVVGGTEDFWLRRQASYERALDRALDAVSEAEMEEWLERVPVPKAVNCGRSGGARNRTEVRRRLIFFNVSNMRAWRSRYGRIRSETQFRTSPSLFSDEGAVSMWLRQGELEAELVATQPWCPEALVERLDRIRALSKVKVP